MPSDLRPSLDQPIDGRSISPLLGSHIDVDRAALMASSTTGLISRRAKISKQDADAAARRATRKRYTYAAFFLVLSLIAFVVQTTTAVWIQKKLGWNKAYCMLYFTHGSWSLLWPVQLLILRLQSWHLPWKTFWKRHVKILRTTAQMVEHRTLRPSPSAAAKSPIPYMVRATALTTTALTIAGSSWYVAVDLTSSSDLTAIYNCSAFFAYAFSIPLLHERVRWSKVGAVMVATIGVFVVAYGDSKPQDKDSPQDDHRAKDRLLGNIIIGVGSVLYGFYEVLYKKIACPPDETSPNRGMIFANTFGSLIGVFTLSILWIPLPVLHWLGWETFELPTGSTAWMMLLSVVANATFSGAFLTLISLTSPVLSSVAALLTIFLMALTNQAMPPPIYETLSMGAIIGGLFIVAAFIVLSWATYNEMKEESRRKEEESEEHRKKIEELDTDDSDFDD